MKGDCHRDVGLNVLERPVVFVFNLEFIIIDILLIALFRCQKANNCYLFVIDGILALNKTQKGDHLGLKKIVINPCIRSCNWN
jgi:hypothetical protein